MSIQICAQCVSVLGAHVTNSMSSKLSGKGRAGGICLAQERRKADVSLRGAGHCQHILEIHAGRIPAPCSCPAWALWCHPSPSPLPGTVRKGLLSPWGGAGGVQSSDLSPVVPCSGPRAGAAAGGSQRDGWSLLLTSVQPSLGVVTLWVTGCTPDPKAV